MGLHAKGMVAVETAVTPEHPAIVIIKCEHQSLGYVVRTLQHVLHEVASHKAEADFKLMAAMLYYIDTFPDRCHHPKEEEHLFTRLRNRNADLNAILDRLQGQHVQASRMMAHIEQTFVHWQAGAADGAAAFTRAVDAYAELLWDHMKQEEDHVLAAALQYLTDSDWRAVDDAFRANDDPLFGTQVQIQFAKLKRQIINRLPRKLRPRVYPDAAGRER
jgi:hemerythrin-like domain-containing protein